MTIPAVLVSSPPEFAVISCLPLALAARSPSIAVASVVPRTTMSHPRKHGGTEAQVASPSAAGGYTGEAARVLGTRRRRKADGPSPIGRAPVGAGRHLPHTPVPSTVHTK